MRHKKTRLMALVLCAVMTIGLLFGAFSVPSYAAGIKKTVGNLKYQTVGTSTVKVVGVKSKKLKTVTIPSTVKINGKTYKVTAIQKKAFRGCGKLTSVTIGSNVETIGGSAFSGCKNIKTITIKTRKLTEKNALSKTSFKGLRKNITVKVHNYQVSSMNKKLKAAGLSKSAVVKKSGKYPYRITVGNLKYDILSSSTAAVYGMKDKSKPSIKIPSTIKVQGKTCKVVQIQKSTFAKNKKLTSVTIGNNIKTIGSNAFNGCENLKHITIESSKLTGSGAIGSSAFKGLPSNAVIKVPNLQRTKMETALKDAGLNEKATVKNKSLYAKGDQASIERFNKCVEIFKTGGYTEENSVYPLKYGSSWLTYGHVHMCRDTTDESWMFMVLKSFPYAYEKNEYSKYDYEEAELFRQCISVIAPDGGDKVWKKLDEWMRKYKYPAECPDKTITFTHIPGLRVELKKPKYQNVIWISFYPT